jgi:hypothetical protein
MVKERINTGCVTFWTLSGWFDINRLKDCWRSLGFGDLVPEQRPALSCLRDALTEVVGGTEVLIRPLASKTGFVVVQEQRGTEDNEYRPLFTARIIEGRADPFFSLNSEETLRVLEAFHKHAGRLTAQQISSALVAVVNQLGGTRLKPSGGVYWLPSDKIAVWEKATEAVTVAADGGKSVAYIVEHELDPGSVLAVGDALVADVTAKTELIITEIQSGNLGTRAIASRKNEAAELRKKVEQYEAMLGVTFNNLKRGLDSIDQSQALAALLPSADPLQAEFSAQELCHASIA